jgi:diguanylate cyclase (GGDEF)-like protein/putative nucleotidyltransferase with HDIG domain
VIATSIYGSPKPFRTQILATGISLFGLIFVWETLVSRHHWSPWILIPLVIGIFLSEATLKLPFISGRLHSCHLVIMATFLMLGPANAIFLSLTLLTALLAKGCYRFRPRLPAKLLEVMPILLSVWVMGKIYTFISSQQNLGPSRIFPALFALTGYYLIYTLLNVARLWLMDSEALDKWKGAGLIRTQLLLSVALGLGLVHYLTDRFGWTVFLLTIPFALFAITTYQIYSRNIREGSRRLSEHSQLQMSIIETLALTIDAKDHTTHGHVRRVQAYAIGIATSLGIEDQEDLEALKTAALLHDIGKLAIPEYILSKPGRLTDSEFTKMVKHVEIGANILAPIRFPYPVVPIIRHHHERYDGTGYPSGLKGEAIPLGSRILSVADAFDALTSPRPYRNPMSVEEAMELIRTESGTTYDDLVVKAFLRVAEKLAPQVAQLDTDRFLNNTHLPEPEPEMAEEYKLWLRKKSFSEIVRTQREIYSLYEIFQTLGKSLNAEDTMRIISVKLKSLVPYDSCVIYLKRKKTDTLYPALATGDFTEPLQKNWLRLGERLSGYAVAFNQPVVNADPSHDFKNLPYLENPHQLVNSLISPLQFQGSAYGAIALYSTIRNSEVYTEDHVRVMETIGSQAGISIQNALSFESYEENSLTDPLTGLPNSRYMFMVFEQNVQKAQRLKERIVVAVMDLNHFKAINDQYGHKVGDEVLVKVSQVLEREMRKYDVCIRYAGDEFVAFLFNADREMAEKIMGRIKKAVASLVIKVRSGKEVRLGISIGISLYPEDGTNLNQLFTAADSQMYNDKMMQKAESLLQGQIHLEEAIMVEDEIKFTRAK